MKKTLIALAAVAATGVAFAQSSVTIYGKVAASLVKENGATAALGDIHGSRLGFRGAEDLGGGLQAKFHIEHRFRPDTGADASFTAGSTDPVTGVVTPSSSTMWNGLSTVGLAGSFGEIRLGRYYSANFLGANNKADPFGGDGQGALRGLGMQTTGPFIRTANVLHYSGSFAGVNVAVSTGLKEGASKAHNSVAVGYANGPIDVGFGTDKGVPGTLTNLYGTYDLGVAKLALGTGTFKPATGSTVKSLLLGATIPAGPGRVLVGVARKKTDGASDASNQKLGLGYIYPMSKRTSLGLTFGQDSKAKTKDGKKVGGVDFTVHHNF
jgi:predicted porin